MIRMLYNNFDLTAFYMLLYNLLICLFQQYQLRRIYLYKLKLNFQQIQI
uniref:Transmembrane protein n=1 Tax=Myoviridae sp. ct0jJ30 TaxID=2825014 RepID=A0A8S5PIU6_9CAUD|nr:MAG TPA: hypothetical protein [Myoviridae sp. ct0jJ30]